MKKAVSICLLVFAVSAIGSACSYLPVSFCTTNDARPDDLVVSGKIVHVDSNGIDLAIMDVLKGSEARDTIRIWDGSDFECNGPWSMAAADLGAVHDSIIAILPVIDSIENSWEVIGDYRRPVYFGYTPDLDIINDTLVGYITGNVLGQYTDKIAYRDFKDHWENNMNDCSNLVGIREVDRSNILFYTNPVQTTFKIRFQNESPPGRTLKIFSPDGKEIESLLVDKGLIEIDFSGLSAGLHLVHIIEHEGEQSILKVMKQ